MKLIIKLEEIINLFSVNCDALLMQILFKLIALLIADQRCGTAYHGTFNCLASKTAVLHLRQRNFIHVAATLRADLNQTVLGQFDECFSYRLA